jgi:hypothetical protein
VRSLIKLAVEGSDSDRRALLDHLRTMCRAYVEELPLLGGDPNAPWKPSVRFPGGGKAFPYLLTYVDTDATTLPLLVEMYLRMQEALKQYHKVDDDEWFSSKDGLVFAYACDYFLNMVHSRADLQEKLAEDQRKVLREYALHRAARTKDWDLDLKQCVVMELAVAFVQAGTKGGVPDSATTKEAEPMRPGATGAGSAAPALGEINNEKEQVN